MKKDKSILKKIILFVVSKTFRPYLEKIYLKKERKFFYDGLKLDIYVKVFHPGLFFSTKYFASFLQKLDLKNKKLLEVGCGSGLLSLVSAKKEALVSSVDISEIALENTLHNAKKNGLKIKIYKSNIFKDVNEKFDVVIVNPPFFPKEPKSLEKYAWYCGKNFEYFYSFFSDLNKVIHENSEIFMLLADNCEIEKIKSIGHDFGYSMDIVSQKFFLIEDNYIFEIKKNNKK